MVGLLTCGGWGESAKGGKIRNGFHEISNESTCKGPHFIYIMLNHILKTRFEIEDVSVAYVL